MEDLIRQYITEVIKNEGVNVYGMANRIFGENPLRQANETPIVVVELAEIPKYKRTLIEDIIYEKTGYRAYMAKDGMQETSMLLIDKPFKGGGIEQ